MDTWRLTDGELDDLSEGFTADELMLTLRKERAIADAQARKLVEYMKAEVFWLMEAEDLLIVLRGSLAELEKEVGIG